MSDLTYDTRRGHCYVKAENGRGDFTGPDGPSRALFFDAIVTLDGHEPMRWEHGVCEPSEDWLKPIKPDTPTTPTDDRHTTEESK